MDGTEHHQVLYKTAPDNFRQGYTQRAIMAAKTKSKHNISLVPWRESLRFRLIGGAMLSLLLLGLLMVLVLRAHYQQRAA